jgi:hypothetical protein
MHPSARLVGLSVLLWACASNPPAEPLRPRSARSVFYCAVGLFEQDGYVLESEEHDPDETGIRTGRLRRGNDVGFLSVVHTASGEINVRVRIGQYGSPSAEAVWLRRITQTCMQ